MHHESLSVFGNTGFHFILKGTAKPMTDPWVKFKGEQIDFPSPTPEPPDYIHEVNSNYKLTQYNA